MKSLAAVALAVVFAACGFAQSYGSNTGFGRVIYPGTGQPPPNGATGFGRVLFPGTGGPPGSPLSITDTSFASRLGSTVSGLNGFEHRRVRRLSQPAFGTAYAYPVYVGGGYSDYGYAPNGYAPQEQPNITIVNPPQQMPQVVINQNFIPEHATPVMREYTEDSSGGIRAYEVPGRESVEAPAEDSANFYLIAFKDHSIYSAFAYWVEGDTLHYVTAQRVHNQASLSLVDRDLTEKLNRDRNMQVKLPK